MSEEAIAQVAETSAPAAEEGTAQPAEVVEQTPEVSVSEAEAPASTEAEAPASPKSRNEAKNAMLERIAKAAKDAARDQPRDEQGRFTEEEVEQEEVATDAADTPVATGTESTEEAVDPAAPVSIELPEGHPLRAQGLDKLDGVPQNLERHIRALINGQARRSEVESANNRLDAATEENVRLRARLEALEARNSEPEDPKRQQLLAQVKEHYPEQYEELQAALASKDEARIREAEEAAVQTKLLEQQAVGFLTSVRNVAPGKYPVWAQSGELAQRMQTAVAQYGDYVDIRNKTRTQQGLPTVPATDREFFSWVDTHYVQDPRVQQQLKGAAEKRISAEAQKVAAAERAKMAKAEQERLKEAAQRHSSAAPVPQAVKTHGTTAPTESSNVAHGNRKNAIRDRIRERYATR